MSNQTPNPTAPVIDEETAPTTTPVVVEKQSWLSRKVVTPIKSNPKITQAVVLGVGLVAGAAYLGRKTAPGDTINVYESDISFADDETMEIPVITDEIITA